MSDYSEFLKGIEYFKHMDQQQLQLIYQACVLETYDKGGMVISEAEFRKSICEECSAKYYPKFYQ